MKLMTQIENIKAQIEALSPEDLNSLREWLEQKDELKWNRQIESNSANGKLDFLIEEAMHAKSQGKLQDISV